MKRGLIMIDAHSFCPHCCLKPPSWSKPAFYSKKNTIFRQVIQIGASTLLGSQKSVARHRGDFHVAWLLCGRRSLRQASPGLHSSVMWREQAPPKVVNGNWKQYVGVPLKNHLLAMKSANLWFGTLPESNSEFTLENWCLGVGRLLLFLLGYGPCSVASC